MGDSCLAAVDNLGAADFSPRLCHDPIDVVYTWVNGSDPVWFADMVRHKKRWLSERAALLGDLSPSPSPSASPSSSPANATLASSLLNGTSLLVAAAASEEDGVASMNRYRDNDELRYSVRSLFKYTPWVRYVHFVTNGQVPSWLDTEHPRVRVVSHADIFQNASHLPVFSSPSIEVHLHRIPGLSRRFVYLNDDVFFGTDTWPDDFFTHAQGQKVYLAWEVPKCNPGCLDTWVGDGYCDTACNVSTCLWDAGDCVNNTKTRGGSSYSHKGGRYDPASAASNVYVPPTPSPSAAPPPEPCSPGCPDNWVGDKVCDVKCNTASCGWDGGDCGMSRVWDGVPGAAVRLAGAAPEASPSGWWGAATAEALKRIETTLATHAAEQAARDEGRRLAAVAAAAAAAEAAAANATATGTGLGAAAAAALTSARNSSVAAGANATVAPASPSPSPTPSPTPSASPKPDEDAVAALTRALAGPSPTPLPALATPMRLSLVASGVPNVTTHTSFFLNLTHAVGEGAILALHAAAVATELEACKAASVAVSVAAAAAAAAAAEARANATLVVNGTANATTGAGAAAAAAAAAAAQPAPPVVHLPSPPAVIACLRAALVNESFPGRYLNASAALEIVSASASSSPALPASLPFLEGADVSADGLVRFGLLVTHHRVLVVILRSDNVEKFTPLAWVNGSDGSSSNSSSIGTAAPPALPLDPSRPVDIGSVFAWVKLGSLAALVPNGTEVLWSAAPREFVVEVQIANTPRLPSPSPSPTPSVSASPVSASAAAAASTATSPAASAAPSAGVAAAVSTAPSASSRPATGRNRIDRGGEGSAQPNPTHSPSSSKRGTNRRGAHSTANAQPRRLLEVDEEATAAAAAEAEGGASTAATATTGNFVYARARADAWRVLQQIRRASRRQILSRVNEAPSAAEAAGSATASPSSPSSPSPTLLEDATRAILFSEHASHAWARLAFESGLHGAAVLGEENEAEEAEEEEEEEAGGGGDSAPPLRGGGSRISFFPPSRGRLLSADTYADSLVHTNRLMSGAFGRRTRKVPAHMPHMIDGEAMAMLQDKWPEEYNATSARKFRDGDDMQYAFAYFHFLMEGGARDGIDVETYFRRELDADGDGRLNENELRTLVSIVFKKSPSNEEVERIRDCLAPAERSTTEVRAVVGGKEVVETRAAVSRRLVTWEAVAECTEVTAGLAKHARFAATHQEMNQDEIAFEMVRGADVPPRLVWCRLVPPASHTTTRPSPLLPSSSPNPPRADHGRLQQDPEHARLRARPPHQVRVHQRRHARGPRPRPAAPPGLLRLLLPRAVADGTAPREGEPVPLHRAPPRAHPHAEAGDGGPVHPRPRRGRSGAPRRERLRFT